MIAIIEDDNSIRELVCYTLNNTGFEAQGFADGASFFAFAQTTVPSLLLLDVMLPGEDGISILKNIRSSSALAKVPVIMLTAKDGEYDKIVGLDSGADDYVTKPFGMMELISRIKAVLRRGGAVETVGDVYTYRDLTINHSAHSVTAFGKPVELTLKEYSILKLLLENQSIVLSRDTLLERIWGYYFDGETRTVDVHIRTLRAKLGECGTYIETVRGVGYKIGGGQ